jgi:hypothetical protein
MSSRAVRKTAGHTTEDDLAQVLQKVGINKYVDDDEESDSIVSTKTDHRRNAFEMLADEDENNDEKETVDSDNQLNDQVEQQQQQSTTSKTKRKRKIKKKNIQVQKTDEVNIKY